MHDNVLCTRISMKKSNYLFILLHKTFSIKNVHVHKWSWHPNRWINKYLKYDEIRDKKEFHMIWYNFENQIGLSKYW